MAHILQVAEAAVVGIVDKLKGHVPIGFYVLKHGGYLYYIYICIYLCACVMCYVFIYKFRIYGDLVI